MDVNKGFVQIIICLKDNLFGENYEKDGLQKIYEVLTIVSVKNEHYGHGKDRVLQ